MGGSSAAAAANHIDSELCDGDHLLNEFFGSYGEDSLAVFHYRESCVRVNDNGQGGSRYETLYDRVHVDGSKRAVDT